MEEQKISFWDTKTIVLTGLCVFWGIIVIVMIFMNKICRGDSADFDKKKELALVLQNQKLYSQSIEEYKKLSDSDISDKERANINYIIANIYLEDIKDYDNALAYYHKSKLFGPDKSLNEEIDRKIVFTLEHLGRSMDAQQELDKITALEDKNKKLDNTAVAAKIGQREITINELNKTIDKLPQYMKEIYIKDKSKKLEFLNQYIQRIFLLNAAVRKGIDKSPEINAKIEDIKKDLIIQQFLEDEITKNITVTDSELKLYYETHKDEFKEKKDEKSKDKGKEKIKTFEEVKSQIENLTRNQKQQEAYQKLFQKLQQAEEVKVYKEVVTGE